MQLAREGTEKCVENVKQNKTKVEEADCQRCNSSVVLVSTAIIKKMKFPRLARING